MKRLLLTAAILLFGSPVMAKTYVGRIILKSSPQSIPVQTEAANPSQAKKIIEAQFAGQIKRWFTNPSPKR